MCSDHPLRGQGKSLQPQDYRFLTSNYDFLRFGSPVSFVQWPILELPSAAFSRNGKGVSSPAEPVSQFSCLSGKLLGDSFEPLAQPSVSGIGGMAWMPIHRYVDVREIEWRLH